MKYTQEMIDKLIVIEDDKKYIIDVDFSNCDLSNLDLSDIRFKGCDFDYADLTGTGFYNKNIRRIFEPKLSEHLSPTEFYIYMNIYKSL